jgi:hypothetical protein
MVQGMNGCVHHWVLDEPTCGGMVEGRCRRCGAVRDFPSAMPEFPMGGYSSRRTRGTYRNREITEGLDLDEAI